MRSVSTTFKRNLYNNNRNYLCNATITLTNGTVLNVDSSDIWSNGFSLDMAVSSEGSFTALGSVIINASTLIINNIYETYSSYDFKGAKVVAYVVLENESVKMCTHTVDVASYNGSLITLSCLDNMSKFDKPYTNSTLTYPATLRQIVADACTRCGVTLGTTTFPHSDFTVNTRPVADALTFREVISWAATIAGTFATCDSDGKLVLKWFNLDDLNTELDNIDGGSFDSSKPYSTGANVNGGVFNVWNDGDTADGGEFKNVTSTHYITAMSNQNVSTDFIKITGVQVEVKNTNEDAAEPISYYTYGTDNYLLRITDNDFITANYAQEIVNWLGAQLVGLTFKIANVTHLNDPSIEAGDTAIIWDRKNNINPILVTNTIFNISQYQKTSCSAETELANSSTRYSNTTKSFVESKQLVEQERDLRYALEEELTSALNSKSGMYETRISESGGGYTYYLHDKPLLSNSTAVIKITNEAVGVTANYQASPITWYGLTVNGTFVANIMSSIGINFDWGTGGTLTLGGQGNKNGELTILDASGNQIGYWNNTGIMLSSIDSNFSTRIANGRIRFYNGSAIVGSVTPFAWGNDYSTTSKRGFTILTNSGYLGIGHVENDGAVSDIVINNGLNPDGITDRIIFRSTVYFGYTIKTHYIEPAASNYTIGSLNNKYYQIWSTSFNFASGVYINYNSSEDYIYASKTIQATSDETLKNIQEYNDAYDTLVDNLVPIVYTWKTSKSIKEHVGLGARKTFALLNEYGLTNSGFVGIGKDENNNDRYSIDYNELTVMLLHKVQKLSEKIIKLEEKISNGTATI